MSALEPLLRALASRQPRRVDDPGRSRAAVALLLTADPDRLLLIRRAERRDDPWSGHLALPGGRYQSSDGTLLTTAIRETSEETGVVIDPAWCRAQLDDLAPLSVTLPRIMVRPFVFESPRAIPAMTSPEVVAAEWIPFEQLTTPGTFGRHTIEIGGQPREVDGYRLPTGLLWGLTERILTPVLATWSATRA